MDELIKVAAVGEMKKVVSGGPGRAVALPEAVAGLPDTIPLIGIGGSREAPPYPDQPEHGRC